MNPSELAQEVIASRNAHATLPTFSGRFESFSLADGYAVALEVIAQRATSGDAPVGHKLGFTNTAAWATMGLEAPVWSRVYASTVRYAAGNRAALKLEGEHVCKIEPEIVFKLRAPLPATDDPSALLACVEWFALGFEVVQSRHPDWKFKPADAVADLVLHSALVIGEARTLEADTAKSLAAFAVSLEQNGVEAATGKGTDVLGSPVVALGWLARLLNELKLEPAQPGEVVTTGTITPAMPIARGETWTAKATMLNLPPLTLELH